MKLFRTAGPLIHFLFPSAAQQTDSLIELRYFKIDLYQKGSQPPMCLSTFHEISRIQTTFADPPKRDKPDAAHN